ncbi:hypothetical protein L210DRAFT_3497538, partial [Boletus edulis BED1]
MTTTLELVQRGSERESSLIDLPPELLTAICAFVGCPTVVWCRLVCRRLRDVIDGSLELQYQTELVRDGMIDEGLITRFETPTSTHAHAHTQTLRALAAQPTTVTTHLTTSDR